MAGYNRIIMIGNLTRDPELKQLPSGQSVCRLNLASNRQFKNKQTGAVTQDVCFIDIDVWGAQAESCSQYLKKGRPVLVEGRLKLDTWKEADGAARSKHAIVAERVVFLGFGQGQTDEGGDTAEDGLAGSTAETAKPARRSPSRSKAYAAHTGGAVSSGEMSPTSATKSTESATGFKDEQPFEDDLPF